MRDKLRGIDDFLFFRVLNDKCLKMSDVDAALLLHVPYYVAYTRKIQLFLQKTEVS